MNPRLPLLFAAVILGLAMPALRSVAEPSPQAQVAEEIVVKAKGEGQDPSAAKDDATREALRQAVGMFVDAQTVVNGDEVISDKILSATNALVLGSKVVSGPKRRSDGLYEVECEVKIRRQQLVTAIGAAGIAVTGKIDGDAAKRVSEINFRNEQEAMELLRGRLSNLWSRLVVARLIDDKGVPLGDGELPTVVQRADGTVVVCANLQVYFHLEAYYTKFVPDLKRLLGAIAKGSAQVDWNANRPVWRGPPQFSPYRTRFGGIPVRLVAPELEPPLEVAESSSSSRLVWVSDGRDETAMNEHFSGYLLPAAYLPLIVEAKARVRSGDIRIELLAEGERVIHARIVDIQHSVAAFALPEKVGRDYDVEFLGQFVEVEAAAFVQSQDPLIRSGRQAQGFAMTPAFWMEAYPSGGFSKHWNRFCSGGSCDALEIRVEIVMSAADLAAVKGYRLTAVEGTPAPR